MIETQAPSPTGKYVFQIVAREMRMSLWVESPRLIEAASEAPVFDLTASQWSLDSALWASEEKVTVRLRRYPGDHAPGAFEVEIDCVGRVAALPGELRVGLDDLETALEALYFRSQIKPGRVVAPRQGVLQRLVASVKGTRIQG
jgi:hypothetical protein